MVSANLWEMTSTASKHITVATTSKPTVATYYVKHNLKFTCQAVAVQDVFANSVQDRGSDFRGPQKLKTRASLSRHIRPHDCVWHLNPSTMPLLSVSFVTRRTIINLDMTSGTLRPRHSSHVELSSIWTWRLELSVRVILRHMLNCRRHSGPDIWKSLSKTKTFL